MPMRRSSDYRESPRQSSDLPSGLSKASSSALADAHRYDSDVQEQLVNEIHHLQASLESCRAQLRASLTANETLVLRNETLEESIKSMERGSVPVRKSRELKIDHFTEKIQSLARFNSSQSAESKRLNENVESLQHEIEDLGILYEKSKREVEIKVRDVSCLEELIYQMEHEKGELQDSLHKREYELEQAERHISVMSKQNNDKVQTHEQIIKDLQRQIEIVKQELATVRTGSIEDEICNDAAQPQLYSAANRTSMLMPSAMPLEDSDCEADAESQNCNKENRDPRQKKCDPLDNLESIIARDFSDTASEIINDQSLEAELATRPAEDADPIVRCLGSALRGWDSASSSSRATAMKLPSIITDVSTRVSTSSAQDNEAGSMKPQTPTPNPSEPAITPPQLTRLLASSGGETCSSSVFRFAVHRASSEAMRSYRTESAEPRGLTADIESVIDQVTNFSVPTGRNRPDILQARRAGKVDSWPMLSVPTRSTSLCDIRSLKSSPNENSTPINPSVITRQVEYGVVAGPNESKRPFSGRVFHSENAACFSRSVLASVGTSATSSAGTGYAVEAVDPMAARITQCVIGTEMYKYVRHQKRLFGKHWFRNTEEQVNRHRRFVALKSTELTICWSVNRPIGIALGVKKAIIDEVHELEDHAPIPANAKMHDRSLVILSRGIALKFTCKDEETHKLWYEVITHLLNLRRAAYDTAAEAMGSFSPIQVPTKLSPRRSTSISSRFTARPRPIARYQPSMPEMKKQRQLSLSTTKPSFIKSFNPQASQAKKGTSKRSDASTPQSGSSTSLAMFVPIKASPRKHTQGEERVFSAFVNHAFDKER